MKIFTFLLTAILLTRPVCIFSQSLVEDEKVASQITLIENWIPEQIEYYHVPGIVIGIVYDRELIWAKGFGYSDLETQKEITVKTLFRIASISKLFTSTAIMQLRDKGKLRLDDPIKKYLSWFKIKNKYKNAPEITIRHLLTHTSGLPREAAFPYWTDHIFPTREQIIEALPNQEMIYAPETKIKYSNLGMALLGEIIESVSGEPYEKYVVKHILKPLGMNESKVHLGDEDMEKLATGYYRNLPDGKRELAPYTDTKGLTPAANLSSNVEDLAKFCSLQFQYDGTEKDQILSGYSLKEMHRPHWVRPSWESGWGLGFSVFPLGEHTLIRHGGWVAGFRSQLMISPEEKIAVIVLVNADDFSPYKVAKKVYELVAPSINDAVKKSEEPVKFDESWEKYLGKYVDPWHWQMDVIVRNGKLYLYEYSYPPEDDPADNLTELVYEKEHTFRMSGENGNGEPVVFEMENDKVKQIKFGENYYYPAGSYNFDK